MSFPKKMTHHVQLPFLPSFNIPNAETIAAFEEADRMLKDPNSKTFDVDELLSALKKSSVRLVIVTGLSGAGKSVAIRQLED